jgi:hypothetical protein
VLVRPVTVAALEPRPNATRHAGATRVRAEQCDCERVHPEIEQSAPAPLVRREVAPRRQPLQRADLEVRQRAELASVREEMLDDGE